MEHRHLEVGDLCLGLLVVLFVVGASPLASAQQATPKPNILFILSDDYGIDGVGCYGSDRFRGKTPNLDELARTGTRFDRCFAAPVCGPSRCMVITGRYAFRTGGLSNDTSPTLSPKIEPSIAKVLKQAGYVTGMAGKWRQMGGLAGEWGFDDYRMSKEAESPSRITAYIENGKEVPKPKDAWYPDIQQAFALEFLRRHRNETFFLYYPSHLVHDPIVATPDSKPGESDRNTLYDDNVKYLDKQVGELVAELERLGLREKTLIVFAGDNGTDPGGGRFSTIGGRRLSGGKRDMLEGGANVPLIASWKGTLPEGRVVRDLVSFVDLMPTFADFAGAQLPKDVTLDGRSFAPQLRGEKGNPREWIYVQYFPPREDAHTHPHGRWYARSDRWKLNESGELFDMRDAPFTEPLVPAGSTDPAAVAARKQLQGVLDQLNPEAGKSEPLPRQAPATRPAPR
jgi:arylsulfatase A